MGVTPAASSVEQVDQSEPMIYFILCPSYHGATLLSLLLNNHTDVLCLGDTNPTRSFDQRCSCGEMVSTCAFWTCVGKLARGYDNGDLPNLLPQYPYLIGQKTLNQGLDAVLSLAANRLGKGVWRLAGESPQQFRRTYGEFLSVCQSWAPHRIFVDGEKSLVKFMVAASMGFPVKGVIHLTRDPRAFMHSARKYLPGWTSEDMVTAWTEQHRRILRLVARFPDIPSMRLRYEDLADRPEHVMADVFDFMRLPHEDVVRAPKSARKHHLIGNDMLRTFDGTVRPDRVWQTALAAADQEFVLARTAALARAFDYDDEVTLP